MKKFEKKLKKLKMKNLNKKKFWKKKFEKKKFEKKNLKKKILKKKFLKKFEKKLKKLKMKNLNKKIVLRYKRLWWTNNWFNSSCYRLFNVFWLIEFLSFFFFRLLVHDYNIKGNFDWLGFVVWISWWKRRRFSCGVAGIVKVSKWPTESRRVFEMQLQSVNSQKR